MSTRFATLPGFNASASLHETGVASHQPPQPSKLSMARTYIPQQNAMLVPDPYACVRRCFESSRPDTLFQCLTRCWPGADEPLASAARFQ
jgi:hypothetical protein